MLCTHLTVVAFGLFVVSAIATHSSEDPVTYAHLGSVPEKHQPTLTALLQTIRSVADATRALEASSQSGGSSSMVGVLVDQHLSAVDVLRRACDPIAEEHEDASQKCSELRDKVSLNENLAQDNRGKKGKKFRELAQRFARLLHQEETTFQTIFAAKNICERAQTWLEDLSLRIDALVNSGAKAEDL